MRRCMPLCFALLVLSACRGQDLARPREAATGPANSISDGNHGAGNPDFFFLPPLVSNPQGSPNWTPGAFNPNLTPIVDICDLSATTEAQIDETTTCNTASGFYNHSFQLGTADVSASDEQYHINWGVPTSSAIFYRITVRVGTVRLGWVDVETASNMSQLKNVKTGEFVPLVDGRTLPIKFRIERYALCTVPGVGPCASQTVDLTTGGTVQTVLDPANAPLPSGITIQPGSATSGTNSTTTITVESCPDLNDRAIDLPTFGGCVRVNATPALPDGGFAVAATVFNCNVSDLVVLPVVVDHAQADRITLHKLDEISTGDGVQQVITALPHAPACGFQPTAASSWRGMFAALRQGHLKSAARELGGMLAPKPAYAARMIDLGGGGFTVDCCSDFQFALPAKAEVVSTTNNQTAAAGSLLPVQPTVKVTDLGGEPVRGVRMHFVTANGSVSAATVVTGVDGLAQTGWTIGNIGQNTLVASGRGVAGNDFNGPRDGVDPFQPIQAHFDPGFSGAPQSVPVQTGSVTFTATGTREIAIYKNYNAWFGENKDETVLQGPPFNYVPGSGYVVRSLHQLQSGIPATTSLIIITSASQGNYLNQVTDERAGAPNLEAWVRNGGTLVIHAGYNGSQGYLVPGLSGEVDNVLNCTGLTLAVADHALIRGPDATLGTGDDLTNDNIDMPPSYCYENHGALAGILPAGAQVLINEQGGAQRPVYATYPLGAGRVIVTTLTLEYFYHPTQTLINHFYWAINGPTPPAVVYAKLSSPTRLRSLVPSNPPTVNTDGSPRQ